MEDRRWKIANKAGDGIALQYNQEDAPAKGWPSATGTSKTTRRAASWDIVALGRILKVRGDCSWQ